MKNTVFIGEDITEVKAKVKVLPNGGFIIDTGSANTFVKGKKPVFEGEVIMTKEQFKELRQEKDAFKFDMKKKKFVKKKVNK